MTAPDAPKGRKGHRYACQTDHDEETRCTVHYDTPDAPKCMQCGAPLTVEFIAEVNARRRRIGLAESPARVCPSCVLRVIMEPEEENPDA